MAPTTLPSRFSGNAARENHDSSVIGGVDSEELPAGLAMGSQVLGGDVEGPGRKRLVDGNVDAADPGVVHAHVRDQIAASVSDRNVHGLADCRDLLLDGVDCPPCVTQS